jgi:hypothetical protein
MQRPKPSPGLAPIGNIAGSIIEAVTKNERDAGGASGSRPESSGTGNRKTSATHQEEPLIWYSSNPTEYLQTRAKSARGRPPTPQRTPSSQRVTYDGYVVPCSPKLGVPFSDRQEIRRGQSAGGSAPTSYQAYNKGSGGVTVRPTTAQEKQRPLSSSMRPAVDAGKGGEAGPGYSIKYFGVAHGQLGVLTRRKVKPTFLLTGFPFETWNLSGSESVFSKVQKGCVNVRSSTRNSKVSSRIHTSCSNQFRFW